jgi:phage terminase large subunit-like protein
VTAQALLARELRHALDPVAFATERLGVVPDDWQARVLRSNATRLLLNCTRQSGKSTTTAILATHTALYQPGALILMISRAHRQSMELFAKTADYLKQAGTRLAADNATSCTLTNGSRVISLPGDNPDTLRGYSAPALVVFDEAAFALDGVYQAVRPMLAVSNGRLALLSTPHGKRGFYYDAWHSTTENWQRERIPAEQCPRISAEFLATERNTIGEYWFRQEYGCEFVETNDQLFRENAIERAFSHEPDPLF